MLTFTLTVTFLLLLIASFCDFRTREIPDWISIAISVVAIISSIAGWLGIGLLWVALGGIVGLAFGYGLFRFGRLGGGDAKLVASLGLLLGPVGILILVFGMALFGGVLSLVAMCRGQRDYAYVPAITAGFVWYVGFISFITGG